MVRRDEVDPTVGHRAPEAIAVRPVADRRSAFQRRPGARDVGLVEHEIVRAGLDGHVRPFPPRRADRPERLHGGEMHDVQARRGLVGGGARARDGTHLDERRARLDPCGRIAPAGGPHAGGRFGHERAVLGMQRHEQTGVGGRPHRRDEASVGEGRELRDTALAHESLHADRASLRELAKRDRIRADDPSPEREVDDRRALAGGALGIERWAVEDRRHGVERHVDDRRRPAGRRGAASAGPSLPIGTPGIVEVDVGVDDPRQGEQPARVDLLLGARRPRLDERGDASARHEDVPRKGAVLDDDRAPDREVGARAHPSSMRKS